LTRFAVIDVGSNSVKLLIADRDSTGYFTRCEELVQITRLGEGMHAGRLREIAIRRTLETLEEFGRQGREAGVEGVVAVGTAALREAVNGDEFVERSAAVGVPVERISGTEEARLSYLAVRLDPHWRSCPLVTVVDIGGGSTEIVRGGCDIAERRSIKLGAVRLTESSLHSDPPTIHQIAEACRCAGDMLEDVLPVTGAGIVVGVGGTFTNLAAVKTGIGTRDAEKIHGVHLSVQDVEAMSERFAALSIEERQAIPGIDAGRADIILAGTIVLGQTLNRLGVSGCDVSSRGLRWGILYDRFGPPS
jgi:exopolyphosphatase / guanosine-5'-triphosphate,3'-diphosphate pyrophosphatase